MEKIYIVYFSKKHGLKNFRDITLVVIAAKA